LRPPVSLFGALKDQLAGRTFESEDELAKEIGGITGAIPRAILKTVFLE
jgi:hypothetical protein